MAKGMSAWRLGPERLPGPTTKYAAAKPASATIRISSGTVPEPPASAARKGWIIANLPGSGIDARRTLGRLLEGVRGPCRAGQGVAEIDDELTVLVDER